MRKEKLSYIVLLAEVLTIIYLHSVKTPDTTSAVEEQVVARKARQVKLPDNIHQVVLKPHR